MKEHEKKQFIQYIGVHKDGEGELIKRHTIRKQYALPITYPRIQEIIKVYVEVEITDTQKIAGFNRTSRDGTFIGELIGVVCGVFLLKVEYLDDMGSLSQVDLRDFFTTYITGTEEEVDEGMKCPIKVKNCLIEPTSESQFHYFGEIGLYR